MLGSPGLEESKARNRDFDYAFGEILRTWLGVWGDPAYVVILI